MSYSQVIAYLGFISYKELSQEHENSSKLAIEGLKDDFSEDLNLLSLSKKLRQL